MVTRLISSVLLLAILQSTLFACDDGPANSDLCGNGVLDPGEGCDSLDLGGASCESLGLGGGTLACDEQCRLDITGCEISAFCGDGVRQPAQEQCDTDDLAGLSCQNLGYYDGVLRCTLDCTFDLASCESFGRCGDGVLQGMYSEECEGSNLDGQSCESLGFHAGTLRCGTDCRFVTADCDGRCGDGVVQSEAGELCDGANFDGLDCQGLGFYEGTLVCDPDCRGLYAGGCVGRCGDGELQTGAGELCDGAAFGDQSCESLGYYGGDLTCADDCASIDPTNCQPWGRCGDTSVQTLHGEQCDGANLNENTCLDVGFYGGSLGCRTDCRFDTSGCALYCGDGILQPTFGEACDGIALAGQTCASLGGYGGTLSCAADCTFDLTGCTRCGDGVLQPGETCDGSELGAANCRDVGLFFGTPSCDATCSPTIGTCRDTTLWGTAEVNAGVSVALDAAGNVFVAGKTRGTLDAQTGMGQYDAFLTRFDSAGRKVWTRQWGTAGEDEASGVAVDNDGNIYVAGTTSGPLDGQTHFGGEDAFLVKFNVDGVRQWTRQWGSNDMDFGYGLAVDAAGDIYVVGFVTASIDGQPHSGNADGFISRFNSVGVRSWSRLWGSDDDDGAYDVSVSPSGEIYVVGVTWGSLPGQTSSGGWEDCFLLNFDSSGNMIWTRQWGSGINATCESVAADGHGGVYTAGNVEGTIDGQSVPAYYNVLLTRHDQTGARNWSRIWGTAGYDFGFSVVTDDAGDAYVTGATQGSMDGQTHRGGHDLFLSKVDAGGVRLWTRMWGSTSDDLSYSLVHDPSGGFFLTGYSWGGLNGQSSSGVEDIFLLFTPGSP